MVVVFLIFALLVSSPAVAQEASLIDILAAKGVLSKKEVQRLKKEQKQRLENMIRSVNSLATGKRYP